MASFGCNLMWRSNKWIFSATYLRIVPTSRGLWPLPMPANRKASRAHNARGLFPSKGMIRAISLKWWAQFWFNNTFPMRIILVFIREIQPNSLPRKLYPNFCLTLMKFLLRSAGLKQYSTVHHKAQMSNQTHFGGFTIYFVLSDSKILLKKNNVFNYLIWSCCDVWNLNSSYYMLKTHSKLYLSG